MFRLIRSVFATVGRRADTIIALSGMVVACSALWFTIQQSENAEKLERLRWQPKVAWDVSRNYADGFKLTIRNEGLGPAYIKWVQAFWDDQMMPHWPAIYAEVNEMEGGVLPSEIQQAFGFAHNETVLPPDGERSQHRMLSELEPQWRDGLWRGANRHMSFVVCYCSMLGECGVQAWTKAEEILHTKIKPNLTSCEFETRYDTFFGTHPEYWEKRHLEIAIRCATIAGA